MKKSVPDCCVRARGCSDCISEPSALNKCFIPAPGDAASVQAPIFPAAPPGGSTAARDLRFLLWFYHNKTTYQRKIPPHKTNKKKTPKQWWRGKRTRHISLNLLWRNGIKYWSYLYHINIKYQHFQLYAEPRRILKQRKLCNALSF